MFINIYITVLDETVKTDIDDNNMQTNNSDTSPLRTDNKNVKSTEVETNSSEYESRNTSEQSTVLAKNAENLSDVNTNTHVSTPEQIYIKSEPDCEQDELNMEVNPDTS